MYRRCALLFMLCLPLAVLAQAENDEWYQNKPIADITFTGLQNVDPGDLTGITEEYIGQSFTDRRFLELQQRLYALDYFTQIIPNAERADAEGNEVVIEFAVQERPVVGSIIFEGNRNLRTGRLNDTIVVSEGDIVSRSRVRLDESEVRKMYRENGYTEAEVTGRIVDTDDPSVQNVVFTVTEGLQTTIRSISFVGNAFASDGALRGAMESKQQSLFNSGVYQEAELQQDRRRLISYYTQRGFIDASVEDVQIDVDEEGSDRSHVIITIYLSEGDQYTFGGMEFRGNQVFGDEELTALVRHRIGSTVNQSRIDQDYQRIADLYYSNGYIFNEIDLEQQRDEEDLVVSYVVSVEEFSRAHIENIIVRGNTKTKDHVIYRELPFETGDIFSAGKIRDGLYNLMNTGFFNNVVPDTPQGSTTGLMDLIIDVEEGHTADVRVGLDIGGSQDFPVSGRLAWQDANFRGLGQTVGAEIVASPAEQSLSFNFREPWLFGQRWSAGANMTLRRAVQRNVLQSFPGQDEPYGATADDDVSVPDEYRMEMNNWDIVLGGSTGYRFLTPAGRLNLSTNLSTGLKVTTYDEELYFSPYRRDNEASINNRVPQWENRWRVGVNLDTRDLRISPSRGYYLSQSVGLTGGFLFGDFHFIQTESTGELYHTIFDWPVFDTWSWKMVARGRSSMSTILPQFWIPGQDGGGVVTDGRGGLAVNGITNARGWRQADTSQSLSGLRGLWENTFELRMPINEQILWFDGFFDATFPYSELGDIGSTQFEDGLYGIGAGIRFSIPQLPISLYLARLFKIEDGGIQWQTGELFNGDNEDGKGLRFVLSFNSSFF